MKLKFLLLYSIHATYGRIQMTEMQKRLKSTSLQGMAELQSIFSASFFELSVKYDNVQEQQEPKPPPRYEREYYVRKHAKDKERWRVHGKPAGKKRPTKIRPDEEFM